MNNGEFDERVLTTITPEGDYLLVNPATDLIGYAGWQWISRAAKPGFIAACKEFRARTGRAVFLREAFRSLDTQKYYYAHPQGGVAAYPGTSIHGLGDAVDIWSEINTSFTTPEHLVWVEVAKKHGWTNTGVNFGEPWHQQFSTADVTTDPAGTGTTTPIGDEDLPLNADDKKWISDTIAAQVNAEVVKIINGSVFAGVKSGTAARDAVLAAPITVSDGKGGSVTGTVAQAIRDTRNLAATAATNTSK